MIAADAGRPHRAGPSSPADIAAALGQPYGVLGSDLAPASDRVEPTWRATPACCAHTLTGGLPHELRQPVLACLDEAVQRDPGYAEPWAMLGWLHLDAARYAFVPDADGSARVEQALDFASKAVAIDPESVVALQALAAVQFHLGNFDESEHIQRQALALNPNDPDTLAQLGWRLAIRGRWDEGPLPRARDRPDRQPAGLVLRPDHDPPLPRGPVPGDATLRRALRDRRSYRRLPPRDCLGRARQQPSGTGNPGRNVGASPALARDPAAVYRRFQPVDGIIEPLMQGLRNAGWIPAGSHARGRGGGRGQPLRSGWRGVRRADGGEAGGLEQVADSSLRYAFRPFAARLGRGQRFPTGSGFQ